MSVWQVLMFRFILGGSTVGKVKVGRADFDQQTMETCQICDIPLRSNWLVVSLPPHTERSMGTGNESIAVSEQLIA